jgi:hypothetical protein
VYTSGIIDDRSPILKRQPLCDYSWGEGVYIWGEGVYIWGEGVYIWGEGVYSSEVVDDMYVQQVAHSQLS